MNSRRLRPRDPPRNGCDRWRQRRGRGAQRKTLPYSGKIRSFAIRAARFRRALFAFPYEGKVAANAAG